MPAKKANPGELNNTISLFLKELPDPTKSRQSVYRKEASINNKKVVLMAQQSKGANGMTWTVNVT